MPICAGELPWRFAPEQRVMQVHPGQLVQVVYDIENTGSRPIVGQAIPSYGRPAPPVL